MQINPNADLETQARYAAGNLRSEADLLEKSIITDCLTRYAYAPAVSAMRQSADVIDKLLDNITKEET